MSGYEVVIGEIRRAAKAASDAADIVRQVKLAESVQQIGSALPSSRSASVVPTLAAAWRQQLTTWAADATTYADKLSAAADSYEASDVQAAANIRVAGTGPGMGRTRPELW
ncbi:hypothetical protein ACFP2T_03140 [Plantactinospora solaniradicis]|uniref:WXG100 family type VII secretion target n=1 Tax=Plantactinospora solaniradicis TaxID=1723736 RepID=A0ABW1K3Y1_9ACTN